MQKILISFFIFSLSINLYSLDEWKCNEIINDQKTLTECINQNNEVVIIDELDTNFTLKVLGDSYIAYLNETLDGISGKLTKSKGKLILEANFKGYNQTSIKVEVNEKLEPIGKEILIINPENSDFNYLRFEGEYYFDQDQGYLRHGQGETIYSDGSTFVGIYQDDRKINGEEVGTLGHRCKGDYVDDSFYSGECFFSSGDYYQGYIVNDLTQGFGRYVWADGDIYEGFHFEGKKSGKGKYIYPNGDFHVGLYKNDLKDGYGYEYFTNENYDYFYGTYKNGFRSEGVFIKDGKPLYMGKLVPSSSADNAFNFNGSIFNHDDNDDLNLISSGEFNGNLLCDGKCSFFSDDEISTGTLKDGNPNGVFNIITKDNSFSGYLDSDFLIQGQTIWQNHIGRFSWEGNFTDGLADGQGIAIFDEGNDDEFRRLATFKEGDFIGSDELNVKSFINNKRIALVIGNDNYISNPLQFAVSDSIGISEVLESSGFEVIYVKNATQKQFFSALYELEEKINFHGPTTDVLFYFAGHAAQVNGINYLNPIDTVATRESQLEVRSINMNRVFDVINKSVDGVKIAILDACRNNPFSSSVRSPKPGLAQMLAPKGTIIAFSTGPGETAIDGSIGEYGIYTGSLIKSMQTENITIEEVFKETRKLVVNQTSGQQVPWESSSLISDFYFIKKD